MQTTLIALLGTTQDLARYELMCVLGSADAASVRDISPDMVQFSSSCTPEHLIDRLGGTVKLLVPIEARDSVLESIVTYVGDAQLSRLSFTLSSFDDLIDEAFARSLKQALAQQGIKSRYRVLSNPRASAGIGKAGSEDFVLYEHGGQQCVARTVAVQDINYWNWKDRSRPAADPRSGMLPPKVARMMVNMALEGVDIIPGETALLDPFCGSGTILMEGMEKALAVVGSDISDRAVHDSRENLAWFAAKRAHHTPWHVTVKDVMDLKPDDDQHYQVIVFEGYLGPPHLAEDKVAGMYKGLGKLYLGALKRLKPLLAPGGRIVCALPQFQMGKHVKHYDDLIDSCEKYGYTSPVGPFEYGRESARVKRRIYVLTI